MSDTGFPRASPGASRAQAGPARGGPRPPPPPAGMRTDLRRACRIHRPTFRQRDRPTREQTSSVVPPRRTTPCEARVDWKSTTEMINPYDHQRTTLGRGANHRVVRDTSSLLRRFNALRVVQGLSNVVA